MTREITGSEDLPSERKRSTRISREARALITLIQHATTYMDVAWEILRPVLELNFSKPAASWRTPPGLDFKTVSQSPSDVMRSLSRFEEIDYDVAETIPLKHAIWFLPLLRRCRRWHSLGRFIIAHSGWLTFVERKDCPPAWTPLQAQEVEQHFARWRNLGLRLQYELSCSAPTRLRTKRSKTPPVTLMKRGESPVVRGQRVESLTDQQYTVIAELCHHWPNGRTKGHLERLGVSSPGKVLKSLKKKPHWADVIVLPGGNGRGGYKLV